MKKNINHIIAIGLMATSVALFTHCNKFDQEPQGEWYEGEQKGAAGTYEAEVFGMYGKIRASSITSGLPALAVHSFRSEDAEKGSNAGDSADSKNVDEFNYVATNALVSQYYDGNYQLIFAANTVIDKINNADQASLAETDKVNRGEAHFFRAYAFFNLVRAFGEVPLINFSVKSRDEANKPKASVENIYAQIDADLAIAERDLPRMWPTTFVGRLTWGAARALHARTYMMRSNWQEMYTASVDVINSGLYNLSADYNKIFRETGENGPGSIFELQCTFDKAYKAEQVGSTFAQVQGVRGSGQWDFGWGFNCPTQYLADAFETGDPRKDETLLYFAKNIAEANAMQPNTPYGEKPIANNDVVNKYYNKKVYTDPALRRTNSKFGYWFNIRLIRYSDVLLMAAEAANELGNSTEALTYLEQVRARARRTSSTPVLPAVTTTNQSDLRKAIRHERRVELGMEFDRFYDLVRWDIDVETLHNAGKASYQVKHRLFPLPQTQIDRSNGVLVQNPNY